MLVDKNCSGEIILISCEDLQGRSVTGQGTEADIASTGRNISSAGRGGGEARYTKSLFDLLGDENISRRAHPPPWLGVCYRTFCSLKLWRNLRHRSDSMQ